MTADESDYVAQGTSYSNELLINHKSEYENYSQNLKKLDSCKIVLDMRSVFDNEINSVYWDQGHVSDKGNDIVAKIFT